MGSGIILQMDKAAFEDKELLGYEPKCGLQPDMGGANSGGIVMD
jgi:hypothetical protein